MGRRARWNDRPVTGGFVERDGATWYRILNVDRLPPFLTSIASGSDHWMFASSRGPLTAGRRNVSSALFPYVTEDRLHDAIQRVGGVSIVHVDDDPSGVPWEPGSERGAGWRDESCDLWKDVAGTALCSEHREHELGLVLRTTWTTSERFGIVRFVELLNCGNSTRSLRIVDGVVNLLPSGIDPNMQQKLSNLVDAYKSATLLGAARIGVFALSSIPVDRAEPSESLRATTVWCAGAEDADRLLSENQLDEVRRGREIVEETAARGTRCAYLIHRRLELSPGASASWLFACEVDQDACSIRSLERWLGGERASRRAVEEDVAACRTALVDMVDAADGWQRTEDRAADARHRSNVLNNGLRGGFFPLGHDQDRDDFVDYLRVVAPRVLERHADRIAEWPRRADIAAVRTAVAATDDVDLERLHRDYLPLAFSRRHGDPSRPWNSFSIEMRGHEAGVRSWYEGNWRDIFQNWEALSLSYPEYGESFVARFLNASTADGYNPPSLSRSGVEWEAHDPDDPWSNIGYWGDHQIVYLTRLLERCEAQTPGRIGALLSRRAFVYVDVPYRIRPYEAIVADPCDTVVFDRQCERRVAARVVAAGGEGKLVMTDDGAPLRVTLAEKLLVPFLVKLTNFVPGAGVWMNTQRPEWNDANNALAGRAASVVSTCALWRHAEVLKALFANEPGVWVREPVARLLEAVGAVLEQHDIARSTVAPAARRRFLDAVGRAGSAHRVAVYAREFGDEQRVSSAIVAACLDRAREWLAATIAENRREDGLFHAYNAIRLTPIGVELRRLELMLEGQVAVLGAGCLAAPASVDLLDALRKSELYCRERGTWLLYPDREVPTFLERNVIPRDLASRYPRAAEQIADPTSPVRRDIVVIDDDGVLRFGAGLRNANVLARALDEKDVDAPTREELLSLYEEVFDHAAFTGRAGTFFGYEGLGCVYWHMVSKLGLAVQETYRRAVDDDADREILVALRAYYRDVRRGLGVDAEPAEWGAFPIDAYSHTPRAGGARQPGMTGQVKEDILCRFGELGVRVRSGRVHFEDPLIETGGSLEFTLCGTRVLVEAADRDEVHVEFGDGRVVEVRGNLLDAATSAALLRRRGETRAIRVLRRRAGG